MKHNRQSRKGQLLSEKRPPRYGRGAGVGLNRGSGVNLGVVVAVAVGVAVAVAVAVGVAVELAVAVGVAVGVGEPAGAQYLPPVFKKKGPKSVRPPHTIISLPLQTAV